MSGHYFHGDAIRDVKTALKRAGNECEIKENRLAWQKNKKNRIYSRKKCVLVPSL